MTDPYAILGVPRDASALQVARAHRHLAKRFHPDLHPESAAHASDRMRRVNDAWHVLSNPVRRADYDRAHPAAGTGLPHSAGAAGAGGHWGASRAPFEAAAPTSTRTWATWRASAAETRAAPRTARQPGEILVPRTRRPARPEAAPRGFRDSGWAAVAVALVILVLLLGAIVAGRLTLTPP